LIVIGADAGDFLRHANAQALARLEKLLAHQVICRHDADRLGQRSQPRRQATLLLLPDFRPTRSRAGHRHAINFARKSMLLERLLESLAPRGRPELIHVVAEREMLEPALQ